jgi:hypothetical protein
MVNERKNIQSTIVEINYKLQMYFQLNWVVCFSSKNKIVRNLLEWSLIISFGKNMREIIMIKWKKDLQDIILEMY